jgi:hypothetical protein
MAMLLYWPVSISMNAYQKEQGTEENKENSTMSSKRPRKLSIIAIIIVGCWSLLLQSRSIPLQEGKWSETKYQGSNKATMDAYAYAQSFPNIDRRLLFVHIPKTAGSTMEIDVAVGQDSNLTWGKCMFVDGASGCPTLGDARYSFGQPGKTMRSYWHVPVHYFPLFDYNPYDADTFAVIRHPIDRAVSEYHYICSRGLPGTRRLCNDMERFILKGLNPKEAKNFVYPRAQYHWISQHDFIVGPFETRTVDHILQMEDMSPYFEQLVTAFGLRHLHWPIAQRNDATRLNITKVTEQLPGNLSTTICKYPYVVDDLALWNSSASGRDLFSKAKFGYLCKG